MRHKKSFNHLGRKSAHRQAMLSNMAASLIIHKRIQTTTAKARELRRYVEPLITRSRDDSTHSRRVVFRYLQDKDAVSELFREVSPKVGDRPGGYTRIIKLGARQGDNAEMCLIELVDYNENLLAEKAAEKKTATRRRRGGRSRSGKSAATETTRKEAAGAPAAGAPAAEEQVTEEHGETAVTEEAVTEGHDEEAPEEPAAEASAPEEAPEEPAAEAPAAEETPEEPAAEAPAPEEAGEEPEAEKEDKEKKE